MRSKIAQECGRGKKCLSSERVFRFGKRICKLCFFLAAPEGMTNIFFCFLLFALIFIKNSVRPFFGQFLSQIKQFSIVLHKTIWFGPGLWRVACGMWLQWSPESGRWVQGPSKDPARTSDCLRVRRALSSIYKCSAIAIDLLKPILLNSVNKSPAPTQMSAPTKNLVSFRLLNFIYILVLTLSVCGCGCGCDGVWVPVCVCGCVCVWLLPEVVFF